MKTSILLSLSKLIVLVTILLTLGAGQAQAQEPMIGEIRWFGFNFCPRGWSEANGQLIQITDNTALFSLYGTIYGGDGRTTFALPDLRGRVSLHKGNGPGLTPRSIGSKGGAETVTLNNAQLPSHSHNLKASIDNAAATNPDNSVLAASGTYRKTNTSMTNLNAVTIENSGSNAPVPNIQPFITMTACVAMQGIYPSRN